MGRRRFGRGVVVVFAAIGVVASVGVVAAVALDRPPGAGADPLEWDDLEVGEGAPGELAANIGPASDSGAYAPAVALDEQGDVRLRGMAFGMGAPAVELGGTYAFRLLTLPCGRRPAHTVFTRSTGAGATGDGVALTAQALRIEPNGAVSVLTDVSALDTSGEPATFSGYLPLDGVRFQADGDARVADCNEGDAQVIHVDPDGDDSADGSAEHPLATLDKALTWVRPGDTIEMNGGPYELDHTIWVTVSGTDDAPITLRAGTGGTPVFDGTGIARDSQFQMVLTFDQVSHWDISGIRVTNGRGEGLACSGCSWTTWDQIEVDHNDGPGMVLLGSGTHDNLVQNSDFHHNTDSLGNGENGDGLDVQGGSGTGNVLRHNRAWANTDDGFDLWNFASPVHLEGNWSFENGVPPEGPAGEGFNGDGHGFLLGGNDPSASPPAAAHVVVGNVAWGNGTEGFNSLGNPGTIQLVNNTTFANGGAGYVTTSDTEGATVDARNNLSFDDGAGSQLGVLVGEGSVNSWTDEDLDVTAGDFASTTGGTAAASAARGSGGALPGLDGFLHLTSASDLRDAGEAVVIGSVTFGPDLGAFPFGG